MSLMRKIYVTRQFFETSCPQGHLFEKTKKNHFQIWSRRVCVLNFRSVSSFVWMVKRSRTNQQTNTYTSQQKKTHSVFVMWILKISFGHLKEFIFFQFLGSEGFTFFPTMRTSTFHSISLTNGRMLFIISDLLSTEGRRSWGGGGGVYIKKSPLQ